jgi:hypothetical protein
MKSQHAVVIEHFTQLPEMWVAHCSTCGWRGKLTSRPDSAKAAANSHEHLSFGWHTEKRQAAAFDEEHPEDERIVARPGTWGP